MGHRTGATISRAAASNRHIREYANSRKKMAKRRAKTITVKTQRIQAQVECHIVFDRLWQPYDRVMTRWAAYEYLQRITGLSSELAHIRYFTVPNCLWVANRIKADFPQLF